MMDRREFLKTAAVGLAALCVPPGINTFIPKEIMAMPTQRHFFIKGNVDLIDMKFHIYPPEEAHLVDEGYDLNPEYEVPFLSRKIDDEILEIVLLKDEPPLPVERTVVSGESLDNDTPPNLLVPEKGSGLCEADLKFFKKGYKSTWDEMNA